VTLPKACRTGFTANKIAGLRRSKGAPTTECHRSWSRTLSGRLRQALDCIKMAIQIYRYVSAGCKLDYMCSPCRHPVLRWATSMRHPGTPPLSLCSGHCTCPSSTLTLLLSLNSRVAVSVTTGCVGKMKDKRLRLSFAGATSSIPSATVLPSLLVYRRALTVKHVLRVVIPCIPIVLRFRHY
jgi:hypothetical protein